MKSLTKSALEYQLRLCYYDMHLMKRGLFITFEGGEGAGKSAQVEILSRHLAELGYSVIATREPGGTRIGTLIRAITHDPKNADLRGITEAFLMAADRAQHVREVIEPGLEMGKIVISDRYVDSNIAYQGFGRKLGEEFIASLNSFAINSLIPDATFLLKVDVEIGALRRKNSSKSDRLDLQRKTFYDSVAKGYEYLAKKNPKRFISIDANPGIEEVAAAIWKYVDTLLITNDIQKS